MKHPFSAPTLSGNPACVLPATVPGLRMAKVGLAVLLLAASAASHAIDFGPDGMFSLTGFGEVTVTQQGNYCQNCQVAGSTASKQVRSSDAIIPGKHYGDATLTNWQVQPYLGVKFDLGKGYKLSGLLSQRWRQGTVNGSETEVRYGGTVDIPDYWYEKNVALSHEDYGSVRIGSMTTRSWSVADYPYATNLGVSDEWASTGAGYGMLGNAIRLGSPLLDVGAGDLYMELTYDRGNTNFTRLKPEFYELYAQYHKGDLVVDAMYQDAHNGSPGAWGHGPFSGVTPYAADENWVNAGSTQQLSGNRQSITMLMARYQVDAKIEVSAGLRRNEWSGNSLFYTGSGAVGGTDWTSVFNADFNTTAYTGYSASSIDTLLGARYRTGPWTFSTGLVYLGKASTDNPSERGQSNSAQINTFGMRYNFGRGLEFESTLGLVHYGQLGLSPMSMPGNASGTNVDSRITQDGGWLTLGFVYVF